MPEPQPDTAPPAAGKVATLPDEVPMTALTWADVRDRLAGVETYLLATVRPDGRPHVVPVLGVWLDGALHFNTGRIARKARNLARTPACVITAPGGDLDLVVEGDAVKVTDSAALQRVADAFPAKYPWWHPTVRDGAFRDPDTGDPRDVFAVAPTVVFAFGKEKGLRATRWSFDRSRR
jgi:nitroimidazol reductase NimA-like FMN-containing flavoprotein (pyridoxamine 5'-phosphate oxidase superfamily)